jgi:hypothetical protein
VRTPAPATKPIDDRDDILTVTIKLASGKFESSISIPLFSDDEAKKRFVDTWLALMEAGLKCRAPERLVESGEIDGKL